MSLLRKLEKSMDARLRALFGGRPGSERERASGREAIELYRDALDQIAGRAVPGTRGDRVFPFDRISIELRAEDADRKAALETIFEPGQLLEDVKATFAEERTAPPVGLAVSVRFPEGATAELRLVCEKSEQPVAAEGAAPVAARRTAVTLVTVWGVASDEVFRLDRSHLSIGRENEVPDAQGRTVRRNELFFPEDAHEANASVSRSHAHLSFDEGTGEWRIYDDGSSLGTDLYRDGRRIVVPAHSARGVMVRPGDEIHLGQVRVRFEG